ncbi:MAG: FeoA domain-containing protein [Oscillospiraceae bacterium]
MVEIIKLEGALRRRLVDMGITPGVEIMVRKIAPLGDPIQINLRGYELSIRKDDAANIEIKKISKI